MYAVVSYDETNESDFLPMKWLVDREEADISWLVKNKIEVKFYWPPMRNSSSISKAKRKCMDPQTDWMIYRARILCTAGTK